MKHLQPLLLVFVLTVLAGCNRHEATAFPAKPAAAAERYQMTGRVVQVRPDNHALLIANDAIIGLMEPMTMPFAVDDAALKAATKDAHITATVVVENGSLRLEDIKFSPPAKP
jgi:Cu/Ag efflux protein CusF